MKKSVETLIETFERLPKDEQIEVAAEILKRSAGLTFPRLEERTLLEAAETVFLSLDREESKRG